MKAMILYAHPNSQSFNHAVLNLVLEELDRQGIEGTVRDLYEMAFNPVLGGGDLAAACIGEPLEDVRQEQEQLAAADLLVVIHPIWWGGMPAILKGYVDRVFSQGFAYGYGPEGPVGLLKRKKVVVLNTTGGSEESCLQSGFDEAFRGMVDRGIFGFCGMDVILHHFFFTVGCVEPERRNAMLEELRGILQEEVFSRLG